MMRTIPEFLVNVPWLHRVAGEGLPPAVRYLNPGVPLPDKDPCMFRPDNLPMAEATVKAMLAQFAQLARETKNLGDISAFAQGQFEDFYSQTSYAIRDAIQSAGTEEARAKELAKALSKAQTELCLAWALEDASLELKGLEDKLGRQWADFEKNLGLDEEQELDTDRAALGGARPDLVPDGPRIPASLFMEALLAFLPPRAGLFCADANLLADWAEYGVEFAPASGETMSKLGFSGAWREAVAPGYVLRLAKRPDPAKPWLDPERLIIAPGEE